MIKAGDKFEAHSKTFSKSMGHSLESKNAFVVINRSKLQHLGDEDVMFLEH